MRFHTTLKLLIAVVVLGALTFMLNREFRPSHTPDPASHRVLGHMKTTGINSLTIAGNGHEIVCSQQAGEWMLRKPIEAEADAAMISGIIAALEAMRRDEVITAKQRHERTLSLRDYGLDPPRATLRLADGANIQEILIGTNAPLGSGLYVKLAGSDEVLATSALITEALPTRVEDLRDRGLLHGDLSSTCRMEIRHADGTLIRLVREHDRWSIQQPIVSGANDDRISQMLNTLYSTRVDTFVWDPATGGTGSQAPTSTPPIHLTADNARLKLSVWVSGDNVGRTLLIGNDTDVPGRLYVRRAERESIFAVSNRLLSVFSVPMDELRSRAVFPMDPSLVRRLVVRHNDRKMVLRRTDNGWNITEPLRCKADEATVSEAVRKLSLAQIKSFVNATDAVPILASGFTAPAFSISMDTSEADATPASNTATTVSIGPWVPGEPGYVYAMPGVSNDLVTAEEALATALGPRPADPLAYRDRTVLALAPDSISRIRISRGSDTFEIRRAGPDTWTPATSSTGAINADSLADILLALAGLRATRLEGYAENNISAYGLDKPAATILVEVTGEGTSSYKSILLGFLAEAGGVYAMIQGQDVVFVLDHGMAELLTRDLFTPLPQIIPKP